MKGPADERAEAEGAIAAGSVPGGKVLRRLEYLVRRRGVALNDGQAPAHGRLGIPDPVTTAAGLAASIAAAATAPPPSGAGAPAWRFLGPLGITNGQTYGPNRVVVSGRVGAIAVDPGDRNHLLVGSAGGGIWESRDAGASWTPRTDFQPTLTIGAVAFDPSNPRRVYAGTGEGNFYRYHGAGVLQSTDGGSTWALGATAPFVGDGFFDLVVDPGDSTHLLAATLGGAFVSTDSGAAWNQTHPAITWTISIAPPGGPAAEVLAACGDGVYVSTDGGNTWTTLALPGAPANWDRVAVAHAPANRAIAYAWGASGGQAYLYRREPAGTWAAVTPPTGVNIAQAWYDWYVKVAPDNPEQVYLGAIDLYRGDLSGAGWSWQNLSTKPSGDSIHPDQHALTFDPADPGTTYAGCDGGVFRSRNRGINWEALNAGLGITEIEYLAQDYGSARWLLGGTQDNGTIRWNGTLWEHVADGDGGHCGVNRADPTILVHTYYGMTLERSTRGGDFGTWQSIAPPAPTGYAAEFYPPTAVNTTTVAQAGASIFISRDSGASWSELALPAGVLASAMRLPTPDRVVVGTEDGRLFRSDWSGSAWSAAMELTQPRQAFMTDVFIDPGNLNRIWATFGWLGGPRVYRSDDGGTSWQDCTRGLPDLPINALEVDPANADRVWVAADIGVYQSLDGGTTWASFGSGLPNALVEDLLYQPHARLLRCGTRNRGVWEIAVDGPLTAPVTGVQWTGTVAGNGSGRWFTFNWPATWHVVWTVMPTTARSGTPVINWTVDVERTTPEYVTYWITVTNLTPDPVDLEGRYCILSRS